MSRHRARRGRYTPPKERPSVPLVLFDLGDLGDGDVFEAMRQACPICSEHGIHHSDDVEDESSENEEGTPADTEAPSGSTPVAPGGSRDWLNRTQ